MIPHASYYYPYFILMLFDYYNYKMLQLNIRNRVLESIGGYCLNRHTMERYVMEVERIVSLFMNLRHTTDMVGVCSAVVTYVHMHLDKPLSYCAADKFDEWRELTIFRRVNSLVEQSGEHELEWLKQLKQMYSEFKIYRDSNFSNSVTQLINYIVSVGMCSAAKLTFTAGNLQLFAPVAYPNQITATSFMDAIVNTVVSFIEGGYRVYCTKKLSSFFFCETEVLEFERKFAVCNDYSGYISTGNLLEMKNVTEEEYMKLMDEAIDMGTKLLESMIFRKEKNSPEKMSLDRKLFCLRNWRSDYEQSKVRGDLREAPFAISFFGESGVGKTSLTSVSITTIGLYNGIDVTPERRQIWADNDKFASNIRSSTNVICFDDLANTKADFMQDSPNYRLIQTINNALFLAPMAEAHMKGKVALRPKIVTVTTNKQNLDAPTYSNKPESVLRRLYHVTVHLDEKYKNTSGMIDEYLVKEKFGNCPAPDIWILDVNRCVVGDKIAGRTKYALCPIEWFDPVLETRRKLQGVRVGEYLRWLQITSKAHYDHQRELVTKMKPDLGIKPCPMCSMYFCTTCEVPVEVTSALVHLPQADPLVPDLVMGDVPGADVVSDISSMHSGYIQYVDGERPTLLHQQSGLIGFAFIFQYLVGFALWLFTLALSYTIATIVFIIIPHDIMQRYLRWSAGFTLRIMRIWVRILYYNNGSILRNCADLRAVATRDLVAIAHHFEGNWLDWVCYLPPSCLENKMLLYSYMAVRSNSSLYGILGTLFLFTIVCIIFAIDGYCSLSLIAMTWGFVIYVSFSLYYVSERRLILRELELRQDRAPQVVKYMRSHYLHVLFGSTVVVILTKALVNMWKAREALYEQGNVNPYTLSDIKARDMETNDWAIAHPKPLPLYGKCRTTVGSDLAAMCGRSTFVVHSLCELTRKPKQVVRAFSPTSETLIIPKHFMEENLGSKQSLILRIYQGPLDNVGNFFDTTVSRQNFIHFSGDATMLYVPELGSRKHLFEYFPDDYVKKNMGAIFVLRQPDFSLEEMRVRFLAGEVKYGERKCIGGHYYLPRLTEFGSCMSPLIADEKGTFILGFHIGGQAQGPLGGCQTLLRGELEQCHIELFSRAHILEKARASDMLEEQFGTKIIDAPVHYKSAVNFLPKEHCHIEVLGGHSVRSTPRSAVVDSVISPYVTQIMGIDPAWGPPKMSGGFYPYQVALANIAHQSLEIGDELVTATICYQQCFADIHKVLPELFDADDGFRPLDDVEIVCGRNGKRFIDPMNLSTSPGFPFSGDKRNLVEPYAEYTGDVLEPKRFVAEIRDAIVAAENKLANRERIYVPWKAALKDEPTRKEKTKTRVFQCAPLVIQAILRKYYLPVIRIMQLNSIRTECAVGCNAEGTEWEQLYHYMMTHPNRFGGDYSAYDQRMPAQLIGAAFKILIGVTKYSSSYTDRDRVIMASIVSEIVNPIIIYDGAVLMLFGSNPSGQNLTVIINCIVNCLLLRCAYYSIYPNSKVGDFRKHVTIQTYGDDVLGSVSNKRKRFNVISVSAYLDKYNIKFTNPGKEKAERAFLEDHELEFLKRTNYLNVDLGHEIGILAESSIHKRLHVHLSSPELSMREHSAVNIDTCLKDYFFYGREKYEEMFSQLLRVAEAANIRHLCDGFISYDSRVQNWKEKYEPQTYPPKSIGGP